jgi:hypothetical protein
VTDESGLAPEPLPGDEGVAPSSRQSRDPASTLTTAMLVYIFVNLAFALPLVVLPVTYFDIIGLDDTVADELGGLRWVGAMLLAWSIAAIQVMARPGGKSVFVTAGAAQLSMGAIAFLYSWSIREFGWDLWYQVLASIVLTAAAVYMWWARMTARKVLKGSQQV